MFRDKALLMLMLTTLLLWGNTVSAADLSKGWVAYTSDDYEAALAEWVPLAKQGVAAAQYYLAAMYARGEGVQASDKTALKWATKAAEQGHIDAQVALGAAYRQGKGVPQNMKTSAKWYTKAAEQGRASAQRQLGFIYEVGWGVLKNDQTAVKWYIKAAKQGDATAQYSLGVMYSSGRGVLTNYLRAYMWFNLGAYNGNEYSAEYRMRVAEKMTSADVIKAQQMSSRCLESGYTDC